LFGRQRARRVAVTEVTRVYAAGNEEAWRATGYVTGKRWMTARDERVCFPAWTMVKTDSGEVPIQDIKSGDMVLTRMGYKRVKATSSRDYVGEMTRLTTDNSKIYATSDHPVWESNKGWLKIIDFDTSSFVDTVDNKIKNVRSVVNFFVGDSNNIPAHFLQVPVFAGVSFFAMPVNTINFKSYIFVPQKKVNGISSNFGFLNKFNTGILQSNANGFFRNSFPLEFSVARNTAKLAIVARNIPEFYSAIPAFFDKWWPSARFRAIPIVLPSITSKFLSASFASFMNGIGGSAFHAAHGISVSNRFFNLKVFPTLFANLANHFGSAIGIITNAAAKLSGMLKLSASKRCSAIVFFEKDRSIFESKKQFYTCFFEVW